jgi:hypothetical protein
MSWAKILMLLNILYRLLDNSRTASGPEADTRENDAGNGLRLLIISSTKRNQNYYRDQELARQTNSVFLAENFDWAAWDYDISRVAAEYFSGGRPDAIFLNYNHGYTHRLNGLDTLRVPIFAFVGDHYDFTDNSSRALVKQQYFRGMKNLVALVSAYPHTNAVVASALGRPEMPFIYLPWAVDTSIFHDLGKRRRYDMACLGALTEGKYPLRRKVRRWIEEESGLRYIRKKRIGGHDGDQFNRALNTTYSAFTCASAFRYTLMKYFEIPASGALMFGETTPELEALGFRDGEHYIAVDDRNFAERIRYYTSKVGRLEGDRIRLQGCDFVSTTHTWSKRISGLVDEIRHFL